MMSVGFPYRHIALAHPGAAALAGGAMFLGIFAAAPIRASQEMSALGPLFVAAMYLMFMLGAVSSGTARRVCAGPVQAVGSVQSAKLLRLFWVLFFIAWAAESAWLVDRFYLRAVPVDADALARREALEESASTPLSVVSAIFCPASFLIWHVALLLREQDRLGWWRGSLAFLTFWAPALNVVLLGSRSTVLIALAYLLLIAAYHRRQPVRWGTFTFLMAVVALAGVFFVQTILYRLSLVGLTGLFSIENSAYAFTLQPKPALVNALSVTEGGFLESALFASSNIAQYYCHGLFELFYQVDHFSGYQHSLGAYTFFVPYKFFALLFPMPDAYELLSAARPHYGTFGTFFGPLHSDFGWFGVFPMFLFGWLAIWMRGKASVDQAWVPLYVLSVASIFLFPVLNMLVAGAGFYLFTGFVLYGLVTSRTVALHEEPAWR